MSMIHRVAEVPYAASDMFLLVNTIEAYPDFLPWCKESQVHSRNEDEVRASLTLCKGGMQKTFTTCNRLQTDKMIEVRLLDGPFRRLEGFWRFDALGEKSCRITLDLDFEFAGGWLDMALGPLFHQVANSLVDAFIQRAKEVYGFNC